MGEDATEEREGGPLLAAAMVPGLGGRDALLSDTCENGGWRGFRARDLCRDCLPVLVTQTFLLYPTPHLSLHTLFIPSFIGHLWPTWFRQITAQGLLVYILNFIFFLDKVVPDWFHIHRDAKLLARPYKP